MERYFCICQSEPLFSQSTNSLATNVVALPLPTCMHMVAYLMYIHNYIHSYVDVVLVLIIEYGNCQGDVILVSCIALRGLMEFITLLLDAVSPSSIELPILLPIQLCVLFIIGPALKYLQLLAITWCTKTSIWSTTLKMTISVHNTSETYSLGTYVSIPGTLPMKLCILYDVINFYLASSSIINFYYLFVHLVLVWIIIIIIINDYTCSYK